MEDNATQLESAVKLGIYSYHGVSGLSVNGVPRCHKTRLLEHLAFTEPGPALTKKGKPRVRQPVRPQDESVEFYRAQLVHYGLEPATATREAAKEALSASALQVPKKVQNIEAKLKKLYNSENLKRHIADCTAMFDSQVAILKKRKHDADEELNDSSNPKRTKTEPSAAEPVDLDAVSGAYDIVATAPRGLDDEQSADPDDQRPYERRYNLYIVLSPKRSHLWASFDFGPFSMCLRSENADSWTPVTMGADGVIRFHWCAGDENEARAWCADDNAASVQFVPRAGNVKIKGEIDGGPWKELGAITFTGRRVATTSTLDMDGLKTDYWRMYMVNYQGGWEGRRRGKMPSGMNSWDENSDTEDEGGYY